MSDTLREDILKSAAGQRMIETVTPIYDNSYVGLWMLEAMGREWDSFTAIIESLKTELNPETATWMLELWEKRYGITPPGGATTEQRRQAIAKMRTKPMPMTPYRLEKYLEAVTGRAVQVTENIAAYTFGISIISGDQDDTLNYSSVKKYIDSHKPSHMAYELFQQAEAEIKISIETAYWRFYYALSGTIPDTNVEGGVANGTIEINPDPHGYPFQYHNPGVEKAGTVPQDNTIGAVESGGIIAAVEATGYSINYPQCGLYNAGGDIM